MKTKSLQNVLRDPFARLRRRKRPGSAVVPVTTSRIDVAVGDLGSRTSQRESSYLKDETGRMARQQRDITQQYERQLAKVHVRDHDEDAAAQQASPEASADADMQAGGAQQHPLLAHRQDLDGIDPSISPLPWANDKYRTELENAHREQQLELQLRLGLMPKMGTAPKPQVP